MNTTTVGLSFNISSSSADAPTVLTLALEDFFVNNGGACYLAVHPYYDDGSVYTWSIGHPFMSNRCMAANLKEQTAGFSHVVAHQSAS